MRIGLNYMLCCIKTLIWHLMAPACYLCWLNNAAKVSPTNQYVVNKNP